jgi:hypothetical protein
MQGQQDRRAKPRFRVNLPIVVSISGSLSGHRGVTRDISASGVFFYPDSWQQETTSIQFKMLMPAEVTGDEVRRAVCSATVTRVEPKSGRTGIGVAARIDNIVWSA